MHEALAVVHAQRLPRHDGERGRPLHAQVRAPGAEVLQLGHQGRGEQGARERLRQPHLLVDVAEHGPGAAQRVGDGLTVGGSRGGGPERGERGERRLDPGEAGPVQGVLPAPRDPEPAVGGVDVLDLHGRPPAGQVGDLGQIGREQAHHASTSSSVRAVIP
nr:hypothetical protein GCM10025730_09740 [Promicromonospora thailandica]